MKNWRIIGAMVLAIVLSCVWIMSGQTGSSTQVPVPVSIQGGSGASGSAVTGNPVLVGGSDGTNARTLGTDNLGDLSLIHNVTSADGIANANVGGQLAFSGNNSNGFAPNVSPLVFNGATWDRPYKCNQTAIINVSSATTTSLVATSASTKVRVCAWFVAGAGAAASTAQFEFGTGAACVTTQAVITGAMQTSTATAELAFGQSGLNWESAAAAAFCLVSTGTGVQTGYVSYAQY